MKESKLSLNRLAKMIEISVDNLEKSENDVSSFISGIPDGRVSFKRPRPV